MATDPTFQTNCHKENNSLIRARLPRQNIHEFRKTVHNPDFNSGIFAIIKSLAELNTPSRCRSVSAIFSAIMRKFPNSAVSENPVSATAMRALSQRQNTDSLTCGSYCYNRSSQKCRLIFSKCANNPITLRFGRSIGGPQLHNRWLSTPRFTEQSSKIQIIGKNNFTPPQRLFKNFMVRSHWRTAGHPVFGRNSCQFEHLQPIWRKVHIDQHLQADSSGTSISSLRHAANWSAAKISFASKYGYIFRISSDEWPAANNPSTVPTVTRMPRIQGFPPITAGSKVMRSISMPINMLQLERACKSNLQWGRAPKGADMPKGMVETIPTNQLQWSHLLQAEVVA